MKKIYLIILALFPTLLWAQKWVKNARQMQVNVLAYNQKGEMSQSQGVRLGDGNVVITEYDLLKGATRVVVSDMSGTEYHATTLGGASSLYNVAKLNLAQKPKKFPTPPLCETALKEGDVVYILPTTKADKKALVTTDTVLRAETFKENYNYYTLSHTLNERLIGGAVLNSEGKLVGILQAAAKADGNSFVIDARFPYEQTITALNAKGADFQQIDLPLQLPEGEEQASTFLFFADRTNLPRFLSYTDAFIALYPKSATGYNTKAEALVAAGEFQRADSVYEAALQQDGVPADELHYSRSNAAYKLCLTPMKDKYEAWTAQFALDEAAKANAVKPLPAYTLQEANCHYLLKQYQEAHDKFLALTHTNMRTPDLFMYAAVCRKAMDETLDNTIALMDSAVACYGQPYPSTAAPTILTRGKTLQQAGRFREAVKDYNEYEHLMSGQMDADFYYEREQLELRCRMFPAALNDIERAIRLQPDEPVYYAEAAALNYRVGEVDDAITYAEKAITLASDFSDAYRILGVCHKQKGNTAKAKEYLLKAKELGDEMADGILEGLQ